MTRYRSPGRVARHSVLADRSPATAGSSAKDVLGSLLYRYSANTLRQVFSHHAGSHGTGIVCLCPRYELRSRERYGAAGTR